MPHPMQTRNNSRPLLLPVVIMISLAWFAGCNDSNSTLGSSGKGKGSAQTRTSPLANAEQTVDDSLVGSARSKASPVVASAWLEGQTLPLETWDVLYLGNRKVGYVHSKVDKSPAEEGDLLQLESDSLLRILRGGQPIEQRFRIVSIEKRTGELVQFEAQLGDSSSTVTTKGVVVDGKLRLTITGGKQNGTREFPWQNSYRGPFALDQLLRNQPLQPDEVREATYLSVPLFQPAELKIKGKEMTSTPLVNGETVELQEVETQTELNKQPLFSSTCWVDARGETLKSYSAGVQVVTYRCDRSMAESVTFAASADLMQTTSVALASPIADPHHAEKLSYRIRAEGSDPFKLFSTKTNQSIKSLDAATSEVTVYSVRPAGPLGEGIQQDDPPQAADREPSPLIQSTDTKVVALAKELAGTASSDWDKAVALEKGLHNRLHNKDFTRAFASAAEVAEQLQGDCTEHAVLLAAMLRSQGIPARVASGLVYFESPQGPMFGYHMWNEAHIEGRWIPLDATLGLGGIGAGHIKIVESSLPDYNPYAALVPVLQAIGKLKIEVAQ